MYFNRFCDIIVVNIIKYDTEASVMNITFLIGNGFDIKLGLKTRYTDFYPIYINSNKNKEGLMANKNNNKIALILFLPRLFFAIF